MFPDVLISGLLVKELDVVALLLLKILQISDSLFKGKVFNGFVLVNFFILGVNKRHGKNANSYIFLEFKCKW